MDNPQNKSNIPVKSLVISLVVLVLIVAGLSGGPNVSRPELQLAQVGRALPTTAGACLVLNLTNPALSGTTSINDYRITLSKNNNVVAEFDANIANNIINNISRNNISSIVSPVLGIQGQRVNPASRQFLFRNNFIGEYAVAFTPVFGDQLITRATTRITVNAGQCPTATAGPCRQYRVFRRRFKPRHRVVFLINSMAVPLRKERVVVVVVEVN
jgi:hypothetical protein